MAVYEGIWASGLLVRWHGLSHAKYREIRSRWGYPELTLTSPMGMYCEVYAACLVDGPAVEDCPAGIVSQIGLHQLNNNPGFAALAIGLRPLHSTAGFGV